MKLLQIDHRLTTPYHPQVSLLLGKYDVAYVVITLKFKAFNLATEHF